MASLRPQVLRGARSPGRTSPRKTMRRATGHRPTQSLAGSAPVHWGARRADGAARMHPAHAGSKATTRDDTVWLYSPRVAPDSPCTPASDFIHGSALPSGPLMLSYVVSLRTSASHGDVGHRASRSARPQWCGYEHVDDDFYDMICTMMIRETLQLPHLLKTSLRSALDI